MATLKQLLNVHEITKPNTTNTKQWYIKNYPTDDLGEDIEPYTTLEEIYFEPWNVYELSTHDSVIRERIFEELANKHNIDYDLIYSAWLDGYTTSAARKNWQAFAKGLITASECASNQEKIKKGLL